MTGQEIHLFFIKRLYKVELEDGRSVVFVVEGVKEAFQCAQEWSFGLGPDAIVKTVKKLELFDILVPFWVPEVISDEMLRD